MESRSLHLPKLLLLFAFTHLFVSSTALTSQRIRTSMEGAKEIPLYNEAVQGRREVREGKEAGIGTGIEDIEDYPGSGPNTRHSPPTDGN